MLRFLVNPLLAFAAIATAASVTAAHEPLAADKLDRLWDELLEEEPIAARALLTLAKYPDQFVAHAKAEVEPLTLEAAQLEELLKGIGSNDPDVWQAAFVSLEYFDPRLAMDLEPLMRHPAVKVGPARSRLVDVLSGFDYEEKHSCTATKDEFIRLESIGSEGHIFRGNRGNRSHWFVESRVSNLNSGKSRFKNEWTRLVRALALLESIGSDEAYDLIKSVATGHPDAQPTKFAIEILEAKAKATPSEGAKTQESPGALEAKPVSAVE